MRTCYISIPSRTRADHLGREIDFERVYQELILPAVKAQELVGSRGNDLEHSAVFHRSLLKAILASDVMVVDITTGNSNVMYELGIRHAVRRSVTILVMASGALIPFNVNLTRVLTYDIDEQGRVVQDRVPTFRDLLSASIREGLSRVTSDSPVFDFFPDLRVELPTDITAAIPRRRPPRAVKQQVQIHPESVFSIDPTDAIRQAEMALRETPDADPFDYITMLRRYRDLSAWNEVIRVADSLPPDLQTAPEVVQLLALALNRRGESGDQDRAIAIMQDLIGQTGGDGESYGILGRIYKDRYEKHRERGDAKAASTNLELAIDAYRRGFEREPTNYYPGINVVTLLLQRGGVTAREELQDVLPRVRRAVHSKMEGGGVWELATALQLAVIERDWLEAETLAMKIAANSPAPWMMETTMRELQLIEPTFETAEEHQRLAQLIAVLRPEGILKAGS